MKWNTLESISELPQFATRLARELDPRTVRFRDRPRRNRWWIAVPLLVATLVAGAAALAATGGDETTGEDDVAQDAHPQPGYASQPSIDPVEETTVETTIAPKDEPASRHPNFHDPFYIFTEGDVAKVAAYPLADPPGVVINLDGAPEPTASPESMVGKDTRVRAIRRRITDKGVRYVLGITIPIKRIEVVHEGSVVIVTPVK